MPANKSSTRWPAIHGIECLALYGLHPLDFESRVRSAVEKVRPALRTYGCDVELVAVSGRGVRIRVRGVDHAFTARTVKSAIEEEIYAAAPDARPW